MAILTPLEQRLSDMGLLDRYRKIAAGSQPTTIVKPGETTNQIAEKVATPITTQPSVGTVLPLKTTTPTLPLTTQNVPTTTQPLSNLSQFSSPLATALQTKTTPVQPTPSLQSNLADLKTKITGTQPVSTSVNVGQVSPQTTELQNQLKAKQDELKSLKEQQDLINKGYTITAPSEKPAETPQTNLQQYVDSIREANKPLTDAYTKYVDTLANLPKSVDEYSRLAKEKGIPELEGKIKDITTKAYGVEAQIESLPEDVKKRVQDFLITQGQYEKLTSAEAKPLTALYNALAREQGLLVQDRTFRIGEIETMLGLVDKDTQNKLKALELGIKIAEGTASMEQGLAKTGYEALTKAPETIGTESTGYFKWNPETQRFESVISAATKEKTTNDYDNWQLAGGQTGTGQSFAEFLQSKGGGGALDVLDVQRYQELYPEASISVNDTKETAAEKIWYTYDLANSFKQLKDAGQTRQQVEEAWKAENNATEIPPEVGIVLDEVFKETLWDKIQFWK